MKNKFYKIGIVGASKLLNSFIYRNLYSWLIRNNYEVICEYNIASKLKLKNINVGGIDKISEFCDLVIVIGGDGSILKIAKIISKYNTKVIGINHGNLGFLADLDPVDYNSDLFDVLRGKYILDKRFLLKIKIYNNTDFLLSKIAMNEIVLHSNKLSHMIKFKVYIDNQFSFYQRSDGLIISTPTGSTAYSLSAGGPIVYPSLNVLVIVPMFPHTLSARPLVISSNSFINLYISNILNDFVINYDSKEIKLFVKDNYRILVKRSKYNLNLIHPLNYNYFNILNSKLNWLKK